MSIKPKSRFIISITVILLLMGFWAYAQTIPLLHYTQKDGLPSNTVYGVYSDSKGYLWVASDKGIARYNGRGFKTYSTADGLPDNEIFGFKEDHQNRLWLIAYSGSLCYYKDDTFHTATNTPWLKLPTNISSYYNHVIIEKDNSITFSTEDSRKFININGDNIKEFNLSGIAKKLTPKERLVHIIKNPQTGRYRLFYPTKYFDITNKGDFISEHQYNNNDTLYTTTYANGIHFLSKKGIYNKDMRLIYSFEKSSTYRCLLIDKKNLLLSNDTCLTLNGKDTLLNNVFVTGINQDKIGNFWISTKDNGVYYITKYFQKSRNFTNSFIGRITSSKKHNDVLLFVSDYDNFYELSTIVKVLYINPAFKSSKKSPSINSNTSYLIVDPSTYIKFSPWNVEMLTIQKNGSFLQRRFPGLWNDKVINRAVKDLIVDNNVIYLSTISMLQRIKYTNLKNWKNVEVKTIINSENDWANRIFYRALNQRDHSIWLSRADGIFKVLDTQIRSQSQFKNIVFRQFGFYNNYLVGFTEKSTLLIYNRYDDENPISDSIADKSCILEKIYPIDDHRAIISTNNYYRLLTLYPPDKSGKPRFSIQVIENLFIPELAEYIAADSNNCYFFKEGTITRIATPVLFTVTPPPVPVFSSFKALDKAYLIKPEIKISYDQSKSINITFDNISFVGKDITCQYSITDNGKDEWREITGNEINLNTPGYGTYLIKIRSKTLSSGYSKPAVIRLIVQKPFWATWWFIGLCALALIMLVWGIIVFITWRKLRKKQKEHDADMKYQQSEYKALNALMNPHFIFNSLNNIQGLINKDEKRIANEYLVIFSDLVRQNMHNISKGFISLQQELTLIENYLTLEKLRFKELVNYEIIVEEDVDVDDIMIPPLMIQPLVENAVKHGLLPKQSTLSKVSVRVYEKDSLLYIVIEDNGIGLTKSLKSENKLHNSFGLSNLQKRTEHLKKIQQHEINIEVAELKNSDGTVKGTQAVVTLKLNDV